MGKKNPAAVALGRKGGEARRKSLTPEQRSASARYAVLSRYGKAAKPPAHARWYGLVALPADHVWKGAAHALEDIRLKPELILWSHDRAEVVARLQQADIALRIAYIIELTGRTTPGVGGRSVVIEELDYDPQSQIPIVPKYELDTLSHETHAHPVG